MSLLLLTGGAWVAMAQTPPPLETPYTPFDFDAYRRTPHQARVTPASWASKDNNDLQRGMISGDRKRQQDISRQVDALFQDPRDIALEHEPQPLPTHRELTDQITERNYGETTKGQQDLLARGRVAKDINLSSMSEADYELYVQKHRPDPEENLAEPEQNLLRPMPTLINTKTGGPPHGYSVSQAGIGTRTETRNNQNPFEDLIRALRLDQPVTKGTDPLPTPAALAPSARMEVPANPPAPAVASEPVSTSAEQNTGNEEAKR